MPPSNDSSDKVVRLIQQQVAREQGGTELASSASPNKVVYPEFRGHKVEYRTFSDEQYELDEDVPEDMQYSFDNADEHRD